MNMNMNMTLQHNLQLKAFLIVHVMFTSVLRKNYSVWY
jgi:hypothetical protein